MPEKHPDILGNLTRVLQKSTPLRRHFAGLNDRNSLGWRKKARESRERGHAALMNLPPSPPRGEGKCRNSRRGPKGRSPFPKRRGEAATLPSLSANLDSFGNRPPLAERAHLRAPHSRCRPTTRTCPTRVGKNLKRCEAPPIGRFSTYARLQLASQFGSTAAVQNPEGRPELGFPQPAQS